MRSRLHVVCLVLFFSISAALAGCSGNSATTATGSAASTGATGSTGATANNGAAEKVYVLQQPASGDSIILEFAADASGAVSPSATFSPGGNFGGIATDKLGKLYVFNDNITEFAVSAAGAIAQVRQITSGAAARLCCIDGLAVSPDGAIVVGQDNGEVDEWSAAATGAVAPMRFLLGYSETGGGASPVVVAQRVAVDASDNLYVGAAGAPGVPQVLVFDASASGNASPSQTLGPDGTAEGLTVDASGNVYVASDACTLSGTTESCQGVISIYAASATSQLTPTRVISGAATLLERVSGIRVDAVGNIYVLSMDPMDAKPKVLKFAPTATGDVAPLSSFTSPSWTNPGVNPSLAIY